MNRPVSSIPGLDFADPTLEAELRSGLVAVETLLLETVRSDYPFVTETSRHLLFAGGKRFRPLLVLLAAQFGDPAAPGVVPAAVAIELTHLSTLYHDDVMDEAPLRRGAASANTRWNNTIAILTGDFLFARASELTADLGTEPTRILSRTISVLCEGQIRETVGPAPGADPVEHYLEVIYQKTGSLIATSGRLGAQLAGAPPDVVEALAGYGARIGVAFQLSDDLLDIASETTDSGKTPGTDLREGIRTLPVLYALHGAPLGGDAPAGDFAMRVTPAQEQRLRELLRCESRTDEWLLETLPLLRRSSAMARARATLQQVADEALALLEPLPDLAAKKALAALAEFVVSRTG